MGTYLFIFIAEMLVVTLMTMRVVFLTKGKRKVAVGISLVEVSLWALTVGSVLGNVTEDYMIALVYALGFGAGSFLGSFIEEHLGIGEVEVKAILKDEYAENLAEYLRFKGFGVTLTQAKGRDDHQQVMTIFTSRKREKHLRKNILNKHKDVVIVTHDIKPIYGGYF